MPGLRIVVRYIFRTISLEQILNAFSALGDVFVEDGKLKFTQLPADHQEGDSYFVRLRQEASSSNSPNPYVGGHSYLGFSYTVFDDLPAYSESGESAEITTSEETFDSLSVVGRKIRFGLQTSSDAVPVWAQGASVVSTKVYYSDGKYYVPMSSGTTGTIAPTHTSGVVSDGAIDWRYLHDGFGVATVTSVIDESKLTARVDGFLPVLETSGTSYRFDSYQWSMWGYNGRYPNKVFTFSGRLGYILNTDGYGSWLQMSKSDNFNDFDTQDGGQTLDTSGINVIISGHNDNRITWVLSGYRLYLGSYSGEYNVRGDSSTGAVTPTSVAVFPVSSVGGAKVDAIKYKDLNLFAGPTAQILYTLKYDYTTDDYAPSDLSSIGENLLEEGVKRMCIIKNRENFVSFVSNANNLRYISYEESIKSLALYRANVKGNVLDTVTSESNGLSTQFVMVERDGEYYIEYVDSNEPSYMISTRVHLQQENIVPISATDFAGKRIYVKNMDTGEFYDTVVDANGTFTNQYEEASGILYGLPMECELHLNPSFGEKIDGAVQKSVRFSVRLYDSGMFQYGSSNDYNKWYDYKFPGHRMTGDIALPSSFGYSQTGNMGKGPYPNNTGTALNLRMETPEPFNLLMVNSLYV